MAVIGRFTDSHFTDTENLVDGVDNAGQSVGEMAVGEMSVRIRAVAPCYGGFVTAAFIAAIDIKYITLYKIFLIVTFINIICSVGGR